MICYPTFPGDDDKRLFDMQVEAYNQALQQIVNAARERYLEAEKVLRCATTMGMEVRKLDSIDHRTVQGIHDLVAAWFRFNKRTERMFPLEGDLRKEWIQFVTAEAHDLCTSANFVTGVLDACIHANTDCGYTGEKRAHKVQKARYEEMIHYAIPPAASDAGQ